MRPAVLLIVIALFSANVFAQERKRVSTTETWRTRARLYEPLIASTAERYHVDPHLLWTIAYLESRFREDAISYKNGKPCAYGMMQFTRSTTIRYGLSNPHDSREAIDAAARYVRDLQTRFGPRLDLILAAYNAGEGTIVAFRDGKTLVLPNGKVINPRGLRTGGIPPYNETRRYVAQGRIVYLKITRDTIFHATSSDKTSLNRSSSEMPINTGRQNSFYVLDGTRNASSEPAFNPTKPNRNNSLYVY
jgi:soluble lytic murein transglycosylase-like protein